MGLRVCNPCITRRMWGVIHGGVTGSNGVRLLNGTLFGHIVQTYSLVRLRYLIREPQSQRTLPFSCVGIINYWGRLHIIFAVIGFCHRKQNGNGGIPTTQHQIIPSAIRKATKSPFLKKIALTNPRLIRRNNYLYLESPQDIQRICL